MLDPAACERRVYRLATLLAGNSVSATRVIEAVVGAKPDLRRLDDAHLDRLTVLRARELRPGILVDDAIPVSSAEAVARLPPQQREAWILGRVYRLTARETAKAMDCSVTATGRHLEQADAALVEAIGVPGAQAAPEILRAYSLTIDVPEFHRARQRRRRRFRRVRAIVLLVVAVAALVAAFLWYRQAFGP